MGVWGGTTEYDRIHTLDLPLEERIRVLEAGFADRLSARVEAWKTSVLTHPRTYHRSDHQLAQWLDVDLPRRERVYAPRVTAPSSRPAAVDPPAARCRLCTRRGERRPWYQRADARYCSARCKQAAYRDRVAA